MNYIQLINQFWLCNNEIPMGVNATALYFYLLKVCNSLGWKDSFRHSDKRISLELGISVNTVRMAKTKLKQSGLIEFYSPEKRGKGLEGTTTYKIISISNFDIGTDIGTDIGAGIGAGIGTDIGTDNCNKLNKTKQYKEKLNRFSPPGIVEVENYFVSEKKISPDEAKQYALDFVLFYESKNWMVGKNKMANWKSAATRSLLWDNNNRSKDNKKPNNDQKRIYVVKED